MARQSSTLEELRKQAIDKKPIQAARTKHRTKAESAPVGAEGAAKRSVSLYSADLQRLDEIKAYMGRQGHRNLSDSEALRLACRTAVPDEAMIETYRNMQTEDLRRK